MPSCLRKFAMPRWLGMLDEWLDSTFGRKATVATTGATNSFLVTLGSFEREALRNMATA